MPNETTLNFSIDKMSCAGCAGRAQRALAAVPGVSAAEVNLAGERARLSYGAPADTGAIAQALDAAGYPARRARAVLEIEGMSCASCVARVERALAVLPGVLEVRVNLASERAEVTWLDGALGASDLMAAARAAGYPARLHEETAGDEIGARKRSEAEGLRRDLIVAAALTLPVFVLEMGGHLVPAFHHWVMAVIGQQASWLAQFVLTTLVLAWPGRRFFATGVPAGLRGAPDMNTLVALGAGAAWAFSSVATFAPGLLPAASRAVYFEAAAVIVTLILLGRMLEARAKGRTGAAIRALMALAPERVLIVQADGTTEERALAELNVGDEVLVKPGARVPADGVVSRGESHVDESMLTGEPMPVAKAPGDAVTGGTLNGRAALRMEVRAVGRDTALARITRAVEEAQAARLPVQALVDRITLWFVPAVIALAVLTVLAWLVFGPAPALSHALVAGVAVLIIACPCAMGLAVPVSIMVGTGRAAELGVLFGRGDALQRLAGVREVAFDKTGTLTEGRPVLTGLELAEGWSRGDVLRLVGALEAQSEHPLGRAIVDAAGDVPDAQDVTAETGRGLRGVVEGRAVLVGSARFLEQEGIGLGRLRDVAGGWAAEGRTVIHAAVDGMAVAALAVSDPLKPGAREAIAALHEAGIRTRMLTGDGATTAEAVAREAGIDAVSAALLPGDKAAEVARLAEQGAVAFVGDGINDAPALARADVGIAIGQGTDVAIEAAGVVLMRGDPRGVAQAVEMSRAVMRNIRQNLFWAFAYNIALIPVAAGVFYPLFGWQLSPMLGAGAMAASSVLVVSNALRLRRMGGERGPRGGGAPVASNREVEA